MTFDFKKAYSAYYLPPRQPGLVELPEMRFLAVRGQGDPNDPGGAYPAALQLLYGVAYTLRMAPRTGRAIEGYFPYVVPPLEGLWEQEGSTEIDYGRKADFHWISMIRLPDFVTEADFRWAVEAAAEKKGLDFSPVELFSYREGLCVQCMHLGSYDSEPETLARMLEYAGAQGCTPDVSGDRKHHEIYLSDPRRTKVENRKTVLRIPVRRG